jgi:hypothetical protein
VPNDWNSKKRLAIYIGVFGILIEAVSVFLLASKRIDPKVGTPLVVAGMFIAFVPLFLLARQRKR